jgi:anaerobic selenocysteine-containing dehydrogenase
VFGAPKALKVRERSTRCRSSSSFGSFVDDTSAYADLILPDHSFLESWVDSTPESGSIEPVTTVAGPVMKPLYQTRATPDVLIEVAGKLKTPIALPWKTRGGSREVEAGAAASPLRSPRPQSAITARSTRAAFRRRRGAVSVHFLPTRRSRRRLDAAHLPWLQEMPDPLTSAMWSSWVEINSADRGALQIGQAISSTSPRAGVLRAGDDLPGIAPM